MAKSPGVRGIHRKGLQEAPRPQSDAASRHLARARQSHQQTARGHLWLWWPGRTRCWVGELPGAGLSPPASLMKTCGGSHFAPRENKIKGFLFKMLVSVCVCVRVQGGKHRLSREMTRKVRSPSVPGAVPPTTAPAKQLRSFSRCQTLLSHLPHRRDY